MTTAFCFKHNFLGFGIQIRDWISGVGVSEVQNSAITSFRPHKSSDSWSLQNIMTSLWAYFTALVKKNRFGNCVWFSSRCLALCVLITNLTLQLCPIKYIFSQWIWHTRRGSDWSTWPSLGACPLPGAPGCALGQLGHSLPQGLGFWFFSSFLVSIAHLSVLYPEITQMSLRENFCRSCTFKKTSTALTQEFALNENS